jgi:hypothetical protein
LRRDDRFYRSLIWVHTGILAVVVLAGVYFVLDRGDSILKRLRSLVDVERASSRLLDAVGVAPERPPDSEYPTYVLRIDPSDLRNIQTQVQRLLEAGMMTEDLKIWHPARFLHDGEEYDVKVRLRGDFANHWAGEKKSWRVRFKKDRLFQGRREIDIVIPLDKSYEVELIAYRAARALGLLVPDAGICNLKINGIDFGAYTWIEKYGGEMAEKQGYPAGEIFRNQNVWTQTRWTGFGIDSTMYTSAYDNSVKEDATVGYFVARWDQLLSLTREADDASFESEIEQLVDMEKFLRWNALTWLFGSDHSHGADNLRWYYDETVGLFEPILYDVNRYRIKGPPLREGGQPQWSFETAESNMLVVRTMRVPRFRERRNEILWDLLHDDRFDMAAASEELFPRFEAVLPAGVEGEDLEEVRAFHDETVRILRSNREGLRDQLSFARAFVTPVLDVADGSPRLRLRILPDARSPLALDRVVVEFASATAAEAAGTGEATARLTGPGGATRSVDAPSIRRLDGNRVAYVFSNLAVHTAVDDRLAPRPTRWLLDLKLGGLDRDAWSRPGTVLGIETAFLNTLSREALAEDKVIASPVLYRFDPEPAGSGLPLNPEDGGFTVPAGVHTVRGTVVLPRGAFLRLRPGTTMRMEPGASVLLSGALRAEGRADAPIRIVPARDGAPPWGSVAVVGSAEPSVLRHVEVRGGSETWVEGKYISGQLSFHRSDVTLEDCVVADARADDGLNVKKARAEVRNSLFRNNAFDAYDADWVEGSVVDSRFLDNGGDGVDTSGATLAITGCRFDGMGDKGVSVGERSDVVVVDSVIRDSLIGIASKDLSRTRVYATALVDNGTAIAVYRKKQIFGGARAEATGSLFWGNEANLAVDPESAFVSVASAADRWTTSDADSSPMDVVADPAPFYRVGSDGSIEHDPGKRTGSPFLVAGSTEPIRWQGVEIPDLAGRTVGPPAARLRE